MSRNYYPYTEWEDYKNGVYKTPAQLTKETGVSSDRRVFAAIECLTRPKMLRMFMDKVIEDWPIATEQVLAGKERRVSWLGQCACWMYGGCSDEETRQAWGTISERQRREANKVAESVIKKYEKDHDTQMALFED